MAYGAEESRATLTAGKHALIASGVAKLRFTFHNTFTEEPESMYREIDVFGVPTKNANEDSTRP